MVLKMPTYISPKKFLPLRRFYNTENQTLHRQELKHDFEQKYFGVILDAELKFDEHIACCSVQ